jgi:hypothetical protein
VCSLYGVCCVQQLKSARVRPALPPINSDTKAASPDGEPSRTPRAAVPERLAPPTPRFFSVGSVPATRRSASCGPEIVERSPGRAGGGVAGVAGVDGVGGVGGVVGRGTDAGGGVGSGSGDGYGGIGNDFTSASLTPPDSRAGAVPASDERRPFSSVFRSALRRRGGGGSAPRRRDDNDSESPQSSSALLGTPDTVDAMSPTHAILHDMDVERQRRLDAAKPRPVGVWISIALFTYSSLVNASLQLVYCVQVPGTSATESYLFMDANVQCGAWQVPFYVTLLLLLLMPVCQFYFVVYAKKRADSGA